MKNRCGTRKHSYILFFRSEAIFGNGDDVFAERHSIEMKFAIRVGNRRLLVVRRLRLKNNLHFLDWTVLCIVSDSAHGSKNRRENRGRQQNKNSKYQSNTSHESFFSSKEWATRGVCAAVGVNRIELEMA